MDIKSLYTVIPNPDGLDALKYFLDKRSKLQPTTTTILRLTELVLTLNHFEFDGNFYNQIRKVAMGTKMGPSYACLFMGYIENKFHEQYTWKNPSLYFRYIDDIVGVASMSKDELPTYIDEFNGFHDSINFTHCISTDSITFWMVFSRLTTRKTQLCLPFITNQLTFMHICDMIPITPLHVYIVFRILRCYACVEFALIPTISIIKLITCVPFFVLKDIPNQLVDQRKSTL